MSEEDMSQIDAVLFSEEGKKILGEIPLEHGDATHSTEDEEEEEDIVAPEPEFLETSDISLKLDLDVLNDSTAVQFSDMHIFPVSHLASYCDL